VLESPETAQMAILSTAAPESSLVFVSYAHADQEFVVRLLADLAARGVSCWVDRQGLPPGTPDWEQAVREAVRDCRALLLVASPDSRQSRYVKAELGLAELHGCTVYPLWAAGEQWLESIPLGLSTAQFVDARGERYDRGLAEIVAALRALPAPPAAMREAEQFAPASAPSLAKSKHNLPAALSSLIGRAREQGEVRALLGHERLVTLTGAGGIGKTRLALAVAAVLVDQQLDGVWLVELAALSDPALVAGAVAQALGVREEPGHPLLTTLIDYLKGRKLLLVLDNCEHLVAACAALVGALLRAAPDLRVLATSQEGLEVSGERRYPVPSLPVPDLVHLAAPDQLAESAAVALFVARAGERRAGFALTIQNRRAVAQVCTGLAAAWAEGRALPLEAAIAEALEGPTSE